MISVVSIYQREKVLTTNIKFIYILSLSWATEASDVRMELLIPCLGRTGNAQTQDQAQLYVSTFLILLLSFLDVNHIVC